MQDLIKLPCEECCKLDLSCCKNPQIIFKLTDVDAIFEEDETVMDGKIFMRGEIPGTVYIINRPPDGVSTIVLDYCAFYDSTAERCTIYKNRPDVCKTYGDPKYSSCPYEDYSAPGELTKLKEEQPDLAETLHISANSNPGIFAEEFINPYVEAFERSQKENPEYMKFWESLPEPNFIRDNVLKDQYLQNLESKESKEIKESEESEDT